MGLLSIQFSISINTNSDSTEIESYSIDGHTPLPLSGVGSLVVFYGNDEGLLNRAGMTIRTGAELERALREGFTKEEVENAKSGYLQARRGARGQDGALAARLASYAVLKRTMQWDADFDAKIAALTPESILAALKRHLDFSQLSSVKAGDFAKPSAAAPATNPGSSAKAK